MTDASRRMVGRRTVVRGAVATAWTVPLVQAVAVTPALAAAASSGPADISGSTATPADSGNTFVINATVVNGGGSATSGLTAVLTWTSSDGSTIVKTAPTPSGWTGVAMKDPVTSWTANSQVASGSTLPLKVSFTATNPQGKSKASGTATLTVTEGGSRASFSFTF